MCWCLSVFLGLSLWSLTAFTGLLGSDQHQALIVFLLSRCQCWGCSVSSGSCLSCTFLIDRLLAQALLCLAGSVFLRRH